MSLLGRFLALFFFAGCLAQYPTAPVDLSVLVLGTAQDGGLPQQDLAFSGVRNVHFLEAENLGAAGFMDADGVGAHTGASAYLSARAPAIR